MTIDRPLEVILYRAASNRPGDTRTWYVSELPARGADWGYTTDRAKAIRATRQTAKRFFAMCENVSCRWFGSQPA